MPSKRRPRSVRPPAEIDNQIDAAAKQAGIKPHAWMVAAFIEKLTREGTTMKGIALLLAAGGLVTLGVINLPDQPVEVKTEIGTAVYIDRLIGDDNGDGTIEASESGFDPWTMDKGGAA